MCKLAKGFRLIIEKRFKCVFWFTFLILLLTANSLNDSTSQLIKYSITEANDSNTIKERFYQSDNFTAPPPLNYSIISSWNEDYYSLSWDVVVNNEYAFIADSDDLLIVNVSNPSQPKLITRITYSFENYAEKVFVKDDLLYIGLTNDVGGYFRSIDIYNITDINNPQKICNHVFYYMLTFVISSGYVYILTTQDELVILNISNPFNITQLECFDVQTTYATEVFVYNDYLFVTGYYDYFWIIDVSDKKNPVLVAEFTDINSSEDCFIMGNYAYLLSYENLTILDISNIYSPFIVSTLDIGSHYFRELFVQDDFVYIAAHQFFIIVDATNKNSLYISSIVNRDHLINEWIVDVFVANNIAYLAGGYGGLSIYDVSDSANPERINPKNYFYTEHMDVVDDLVIITDRYRGLNFFNTSNLDNFSNFSSFDALSFVYDVAISDDLVLLLTYNSLTILNITDLLLPQEISSISLVQPRCLLVENELVFVAGDDFTIINISNPLNPIIVDSLPISSAPYRMVINNNTVVLTLGGAGFVTINISNPSNIQLLASLDEYNYYHIDVTVTNDLAFISCGNSGCLIYNISNPSNPEFIGRIYGYGYARSVFLRNGLLYLTSDSIGLTIVNVTDLNNMYTYGQLDQLFEITWGKDQEIFVDDDFIYAVGNGRGLNIIGLDSDYDELADYLEIEKFGTNPLNNDTDNDLIFDGYETKFGLDPNNITDGIVDFDFDGLTNVEEFLNRTDPTNFDTDFDNLSDGEELLLYQTSPINGDTDNDVLLDGFEVHFTQTNPNDIDSDDDGITDWHEFFRDKTDPNNNDTDFDGLPDNYERYNRLDPLDASDRDKDLDLDGLTNFEEFLLGTEPDSSDSDRDGYSDFEEYLAGTDPLDDNDYPPYSKTPNVLPTETAVLFISGSFVALLCLIFLKLIFLQRRDD